MSEETLVQEKPEFDATKARLISRRRFSLPQWANAWIVLIPAMIFLVLFMFYPILNTFLMAFIQDFDFGRGAGSFALGNFFDSLGQVKKVHQTFGFENFALVLQDAVFPKTIWNTFVLVIIEVPLTIIIALLIATFLNSIKVLKGVFQTIFFLPYVTNSIALGLVFTMLFSSGEGGIVNIILNRLFGMEPVNWLKTFGISNMAPATRYSQLVVIVTSAVWNGIAFKLLVFLSGLATIDKQYTDAAKIDGSSNFTIWRRITLPLLSPQILYITITSFIGAFKMYTGVMSVYSSIAGSMNASYYFGGDKGEEWMPIVGWIYRILGTQTNTSKGVAAAGSLILLAIILLITLLQFAVSKKRVHY